MSFTKIRKTGRFVCVGRELKLLWTFTSKKPDRFSVG